MLASMGDAENRIWATVDLLELPDERKAALDAEWKVRTVIWSGPDFRTPHIRSGGLFKSRGGAERVARQAVTALELLGIDVRLDGVPEDDEAAGPLLPSVLEGWEYPRLD